MLIPVLALVLRRAVLDQLAFATDLSTYHRPWGIRAPFPTCGGGALAALTHGRVLRERDVAVDPIAHLACSHAPKGPTPAATLKREHSRAIEAVPREADHLAVLRATRVGAARGEIEEDISRGDEEWVREEDLRVGGRLVREEHYKRWTPLVQDCAEYEVDLGEARCASLVLQCMLETRV
jgi:hypothetical protein